VGIGILSLAFCSLTGCQVPAPDAEADVEEVASLYFERLGSGVSARIADTTEVVLRSAENWETFAAALRPAQPFPPVDFSQMDVLVVAVAVPSGGYAVEFESVVQTGGEIVATYRLVTPGPDCLTALGQTVPFQVVSVRKSEGAVRFVRTTENLSCTA
jgi:hypothetical protein